MFAKSGYVTHVYTYADPAAFHRQGELGLPDVCILDTNSRPDAPQVAYDKVFAATRVLRDAGCRLYFKKTCSVFRGNIGVEFDAMLDALGEEFAVVVLGFPKNGRFTLDGIHYVHGKRLEESEFRNDPIHPMTRSNLVEILQAQTKRKVGHISHAVVERGPHLLRQRIEQLRSEVNYVILDVPNQEALTTIAAAVHDCPVLCGSSALAEELPAAWNGQRATDDGAKRRRKLEILRLPSSGGVLCAAGSLMPQTAAQIEHLRARGTPVFELDTLRLFNPIERQAELERLCRSLAERLAGGEDVLFHAANSPQAVAQTRTEGERRGLTPGEVSRLVSATIAELVAILTEDLRLNRLVIAGGDTSAAVCARLGVDGMRVWKEIQPGLPSCLALGPRPLLLVLKSGSFGSAEFLERAIEHVKQEGHDGY
jgi:uncharacterized protein YgbK (DUF1537 family)